MSTESDRRRQLLDIFEAIDPARYDQNKYGTASEGCGCPMFHYTSVFPRRLPFGAIDHWPEHFGITPDDSMLLFGMNSQGAEVPGDTPAERHANKLAQLREVFAKYDALESNKASR